MRQIIDEKVLDDCLKDITRALLQSDVRLELDYVKNIVNLGHLPAGHNKHKIIHQAIYSELCAMLDPGESSFTPRKGKTSVVMFVGLQEGVERFKKENCDLIIVDTSGRHKQEAALFEEMRQLSEATKPDLIIFVMDSSIGRVAFDQAQAFKQSVPVGAVIVIKMDGHAKGGGALSAVAATKSPVIFIGTGEHMDEFEVFDVKTFVRRLLGMGDLSGFVDKIQEVVPMDKQLELSQKLSQGKCTLRMFQYIYMGDVGQALQMLGVSTPELMRSPAEIKTYMTIIDSTTNEELDSSEPKLMDESRMMRIARGSGQPVRTVMEMMQDYNRLAKFFSNKKVMRNMLKKGRSIKMKARDMMKGVGGVGGLSLEGLMKQIGGVVKK
ncbi:signal recognition particle 54 kDa protein 2 [Phtheirospermum japonicum]|uniref:signal-recognition-particle GTPase n=1 Tax=Phtheirospermum japonicum TaxID=374723 RepID=A0A830C850_9LAMI|nr:signal recognition particle 54 kDa protein 2 [Phtheirospermum japonicum]